MGRISPPRNSRAALTNGAPRRYRNAADPKQTSGRASSATGRHASPTSPKAKITKPSTPVKMSATPR